MDAGQPGRHRALQAREVEQEAGPPPAAQRRLLGPEARVQVRPHPDHPRAGHADRRAHLRRRRRHQGRAARPDGRDQQVGPGAHLDVADPAHGDASSSTRPAAPDRTRSRTSACGRPRTSPSTWTAIIKHVLNGLADRTATTRQSDGVRLRPDRSSRTSRTSPRRRSCSPRPASRTASRSASCARSPSSSPASSRPSDAIVADLAKAGIRTKQRMVGESGPFTNLVRDSKADPIFEWSWGYYSIFDADAILYDVMTCDQPYSYYCNKALDDLVIQGRSTLDRRSAPEIYTRAQKLLHEDAAYLYKWGLRGVWGIVEPDRLRGAAGRGRPDVRRDAAEEVGAASRRGRASSPPVGACSRLPAGAGPDQDRTERHAQLPRPPAHPARRRRHRHLAAGLRHPARPRRSRAAPPAPERGQGRVRALPESPRASISRSTCSTGSSLSGAVVRATSASRGTPTRPRSGSCMERMPPTIYLTLAGLARRARHLAAARHPRRAQAPLVDRHALHRGRGRRARPCRCSGSASC